MSIIEKGKVRQAIVGRRDWAVNTLAELVRRPTVLFQEESGQLHLASVFESLGYETRIGPIAIDRITNLPGFSPVDWEIEGKKNVIAIHDPGVNAGRTLAFNGHIDVVSPEPVSLWSSPPFEPRLVLNEEDGEQWMYGRGSGDVKGGTVSYLWALAALKDLGLAPASKVICHSPVEEECTGNGTLAILEQGHVADACIVPEPFDQTIMISQIGVLWFQVRVLGKTTHVLCARRGVSAIEKSWVVIQALRDLEEEINCPENVPDTYKKTEHPIDLNVGVINGADWASTVAGGCLTRFRFGIFPVERVDDVKRRIEDCVREAAAKDPWLRCFPPTVEFIGFQVEGCEFDVNDEFGKTFQRAHKRWHGRPAREIAAACTTDTRYFNLYYD